MAGLNPKNEMFKIYQTMGCFSNPKEEIIYHDSLIKIEDPWNRFSSSATKKNVFEIYSDIPKLESELFPLAESPKDLEKLKKYINLVKTAQKFDFFNFIAELEAQSSLFGKAKLITMNSRHLTKLMLGGSKSIKQWVVFPIQKKK